MSIEKKDTCEANTSRIPELSFRERHEKSEILIRIFMICMLIYLQNCNYMYAYDLQEKIK